jgi:pSer/pThr/pTyr-binding forkhead associated (FHA) protein
LGSATGTFVNGTRIASDQELKDGDELLVGKHSFVLSIKLSDEPEEQASTEPEITFEVRDKGQTIIVTKKQLFDMALKGSVLSDDVIAIVGAKTKIFADSVQGIVFKDMPTVMPPVVPQSPISQTPEPDPYDAVFASLASDHSVLLELEKECSESKKSTVTVFPEEVQALFSTADAPSVQIDSVPDVRKEQTFFDLGKPLEEPLSQAFTWMSDKVSKRQIKIGGFILAGVCLLGILVYLFMPDSKSVEGAVRIEGTVTLDGTPVSGANVILHPRNRGVGQEAGGMTDNRGIFTVTTGNDPIGRGAVPGEYDVSFIMRPTIPRRYERPVTSGLSPIVVEATGRNRFIFELSSEAGSPQVSDIFTDNPFLEDFTDNPFAE